MGSAGLTHCSSPSRARSSPGALSTGASGSVSMGVAMVVLMVVVVVVPVRVAV